VVWTGHEALMLEMRNAYIRIFFGKSEEKRLLGRPGRRSEDNIKVKFIGIGWESVDWLHVV
jgi:hypothetical protein